MSDTLKTVIYPVRDLDRAKAIFGALTGSQPTVDAPYYAQFEVGGQRLGLDPNGHERGFVGAVGYWEVEDVEAMLRELVAAGAEEHEGARDVGDGTRIASVKDADGNVIGLLQPAWGGARLL